MDPHRRSSASLSGLNIRPVTPLPNTPSRTAVPIHRSTASASMRVAAAVKFFQRAAGIVAAPRLGDEGVDRLAAVPTVVGAPAVLAVVARADPRIGIRRQTGLDHEQDVEHLSLVVGARENGVGRLGDDPRIQSEFVEPPLEHRRRHLGVGLTGDRTDGQLWDRAGTRAR